MSLTNVATAAGRVNATARGGVLGVLRQHQHQQQEPQQSHQHQSGQQQQQIQPQQQQQHFQDVTEYQASLAARVQQINITISGLHPRSAALRDPRERKELDLQLKGLARQGMFITEVSRELDAIISERGRAW